jgi:hypothetical protein
MARRYARDNRGRFSSTGATARGGRLATASGNKRATQTKAIAAGKASGTVAKPKGLKPGAIKVKPQVSSGRQAATDRLKVKTQTRRAMRADRGSVVTPGQRSRLEAGKGATMKAARPTSTVAKPRTAGNTKQQVASRVERKLAAERAKMNIINRAERVGATQGSQRERSYKRQATLERAQTFLKTGKLPGKDNSIAAQRSMRQAKERLAAKNAARAAASKPAAKLSREARLQRAADTATRIAKARGEKADTAAATFADRRRISSRASSKGRSAAFAKEEAAGKQSAQALRSSLRADARASNLRQTMGAAAQAARSRAAAPKPAAKPATRKVDLSASAFSRRAEVAGVRANFAGSAVRGLDRANPSNRKAFAKADALQAASDRYSSIVRKSRGGEFTAAQVFQGMNTKRSTVPTRSEKAAKTRADKKLKALEANIKAAERARRMG